MTSIKKIYDALWQESKAQFQNNECEIDPFIARPDKDDRRGLTLLTRLSVPVSTAISQFINELKPYAPSQYFYPTNDLHITVLSIISCYAGFQHDPTLDADYLQLIGDELRTIEPLQIHYRGVTASPACLMIQGFPLNNTLEKIRTTLRARFQNASLPVAIDSRYKLVTAHATIMRFQEPPQKLDTLTRFIEKNRERDFGVQKICQLELVINDWYLRKTASKTLGYLPLKQV